MVPEDIASHLERLRGRFAELERKLADPALYAHPEESRRVGGEHRKLETMFRDFAAWKKALADIEENKALIAGEEDAEMRALAEEDLLQQQARAEQLEKALQIALLPPDPNDDRNIIVEIKPAAGGEEAALFAGELSRAYLKYAESKDWHIEILDQSNSDLGGIRNLTFSLSGNEVYSRMKFESGVHRVQRVPETESSGRIQTSAATVAVMPEAEEVEFTIDPSELQIDTYRSSGAGGQHVNKTESAIRITHLPTGTVVECQDERSQHKNRERAMKILRSRLYEAELEKQNAAIAQERKQQVGSGDRSGKIRTYNFPQNRVTDHRLTGDNKNFNIATVMDGDLDNIIDALTTAEQAQRLQESGT